MATKRQFGNEVTDRTVNAILRHFRIIMTNPTSAAEIRFIATTVREILTDETGQKNVQLLIDFIVALLMNENTFISMDTLHKGLLRMHKAGPNAPNVLETVAVSTKKIIDEPQLLAATEGLVDGINLMLEGMTVDKLERGISRVKTMTTFANLFKPVIGIKIPKLKKLPSSTSGLGRNRSFRGEEGEMSLQSRALSDSINHLSVDEVSADQQVSGWINKPALTSDSSTDSNSESIITGV